MGCNPGCSITAVKWRVTACSAGDRPKGQEGPYICSFIRSFARSLVCQCEVVNAFNQGSGDVIKYYSSMLDRTGALDRTVQQSSYCRGPTVVVFKISPSESFLPPPLTPTTTTRSCPHAMRRLCVGSGSDLRRPRFVAVTTYRCRVRFRRPQPAYNQGP